MYASSTDPWATWEGLWWNGAKASKPRAFEGAARRALRLW